MSTQHKGEHEFSLVSLIGAATPIAPAAELTPRSISFNTYSASLGSFNGNAALAGSTANLQITLHSLIGDLIKRGVIPGTAN